MASEFERRTVNGWLMLPVLIVLTLATGYVFYRFAEQASHVPGHIVPVPEIWGMVGCGLVLGAADRVVVRVLHAAAE